jgi:hypothetical protein
MGFELRFTDKEITPWGGIELLRRMLDHIGFRTALEEVGLPQPGSNRGYAPTQLVLQFMLNIWCGGNRFEHGEMVRHDHVLQRLFGFARMANFKAVIRFFGKFSQVRNATVFASLYRWLFDQLSVLRVTLDLDSTVMTRYGAQDGAAKGYNPKKPGRLSHHPLMAFVADFRLIANCWLRPGNTGSAHNVSAFLDATLQHLGNKVVGLLRADSGFSDAAFLDKVEGLGIPYIIAMKLFAPLQRQLVSATGWWQLDSGIELVSFLYQPDAWSKPRRVVGIRQHVQLKADAKGKQLSLFAESEIVRQYRYAALVTDLPQADAEVWRGYRGRADCENRIKELKYDFGAESFCLRDFWATEACLNMAMIAYNLMSLFRQVAMRASVKRNGVEVELQNTLRTLRYKLFAKAGYTGKEGRTAVLKLALPMRHREWFEGIWNRAKTFDLPITFSPAFTP